MPKAAKKTLLIISQVFVPDPASVGQHMADVAIEMARRGYHVKVYAANRGYENPSVKYSAGEVLQGVDIHRLPFSSFGKKRIVTRLIGTISFMLQSFFVVLFTPGLRGVFFSTSPPLIGAVVLFAVRLRRIPGAYWAMDLNPDQLIALGKIKPTSLVARALEGINRYVLRGSSHVFALDRFMADRLRPRATHLDAKLSVMPPWPHENHLEPVDQATNPFRVKHDLLEKFVIMYSGNHSPSNPLTTLLQAAVRLRGIPDLRFLFVGGGNGKKEVEQFMAEYRLSNVISLPYQPLAELKYSLSAADIHVVSLGEDMVGIIHPCKIYGAMSAGRPILFFGPKPSHVSDLLDHHPIGWHIAHGDIESAVQKINEIRAMPPEALQEMGDRAQQVLRESLSQQYLCGRFCDDLEKVFR